MRHYSAAVRTIIPDLTVGVVWPTDDDGNRDLDQPEFVFFWGTDDQWHISRIGDALPPGCFKPRKEFTEALTSCLLSSDSRGHIERLALED